MAQLYTKFEPFVMCVHQTSGCSVLWPAALRSLTVSAD